MLLDGRSIRTERMSSGLELTLSGSGGESVVLNLDGGASSLIRSRFSRSFYKTTSMERLLGLVADAPDVAALEALARKFSLCDVCDLGELNLYGTRKILSVVVRALYRYPMLRSRLCYIGSYSGYVRCIDALVGGDAEILRKFGMHYICDSDTAARLGRLTAGELSRSGASHESYIAMALSVFGFFDAVLLDQNDFDGYAYIKTVSEIRHNERAGFHPRGCDSAESVVYHEIGHILDYMCAISSSEMFSSYYKSLSEREIKNGLSEYATVSAAEFLAEAFAEYICSEKPREIAVKVGGIIDFLYEKKSRE